MKKSVLELKDVTKVFHKGHETVHAVDAVNLLVEEGELVTFLGPSGCGKTTTLRMVAGFELPSGGSITIGGEDMTNTPVNKRGIGFVFQNYALFPHMSVFNNVAYGLKSRAEKDDAIKPKVIKALQLVGLEKTENRYPSQLSGGEQQRVALARVIVMEPKLLLMDEPLSNLDAKLRLHMRTEIRKLQKKLGITCLYVTHDQSEALTMADRIVVMNKGKVEQIGTPFEIYSNPQSLFVADFIGQANVVKLEVSTIFDEAVTALIPGGGFYTAKALKPDKYQKTEVIYHTGKPAALIVRPENIQVEAASDDPNHFPARVISSIFVGSHIEYELRLRNNAEIKASVPFSTGMRIFGEDAEVKLLFDASNSAFLPA